jgi:B-box zinc finger protein
MPLPKWELAASDEAVCTLCGSRNTVRVFPATFTQQHTPALPEGAEEGQAACFDHPNKKAVAACQQCGRFVCQLCAVEFGAETWCPSCVAAGAGKARSASTETPRMLYDSIALSLPLASLLVWPFTIVAAPATLALTVMKWRQPLSLVRRFRWRFVVGSAVAFVETGLWIWGLVYLVTRAGQK